MKNVGAPSKQGPENFKHFHLSPLTTGFLIFISGGMSLAQSVGWTDHHMAISQRHFYFSWFIAVIIGALLSLPMRDVVSRKLLMGSSSLLLLVGGILFISLTHNVDALIAGRYFNGIAIGLITVPYLVHSSELSRNNRRGVATGLEQFAITLGIGIQMIAVSQWDPKVYFTVNCLHGILDIILAVLSMGSLYYFIESPVDYLRFGDDVAALNALGQLERPPGVKLETHRHLAELKDYVLEHGNNSFLESMKRSSIPMIKMICYRSVVLAFSYSIVLTAVMQFAIGINGAMWSPILAACVRIFGSCLTLIVVDK
ncbi:uncharacterized protein LOC142231294 [Haematobia irritans]|uniref:uncharacterized protein LOC142231294 n=1 Tax=Haematobia irritans TaxID=7368 RepID=UPI003F503C45